MKENILLAVGVALACLLFYLALTVGASKAERAECLRWQQEAQEFKGYYLVSWQAEQCASYDIIIKAPTI